MAKKFDRNDVQMLGQRTLYQGFFSLDEYRFKHRLFQGGWSQEVVREVFERGHAVVVLPYDPVTDQLVLIEQIRIPIFNVSASPWLLELVAGIIDDGETPLQVAHRELNEEAGLVASEMVHIDDYFSTPGGSSEKFTFYYARIDASQAEGFHGLPQEQEDIKVHVMARDKAYNLLCERKISNAATVIGLQWLQLNYRQLRGVL